MKISWGSLAAGVVFGAISATAILLLVTIGPAAPPERIEAEIAGARQGVDSVSARPAASSIDATQAESDRDERSSPTIVSWLSEKLQDAYRQEALPEIIGTEAGAEAADQVFDYITAADDTDVVHDLLSDALEVSPEDLGFPGGEILSTIDCERAPCVGRIDLVAPDGDCDSARALLLGHLTEAMQPGSINAQGGGCSMTFMALSADAQVRQQEIEDGIKGFLENHFSEANVRSKELAPDPKAP